MLRLDSLAPRALLAAPLLSILVSSAAFAAEGDELPGVDDTPSGPGFSRVIDEDETIYAIQRKAYLLEDSFEVSVMWSNLVGDRFVTTDSYGGGALSLAYHLSEAFAIEAYGGYFNPTDSEAADELLSLTLAIERSKLTQLLWAGGVGVQFSPIYGKLQFFDTSLGNFAFYLGVGAGLGQTRVRCTPPQTLDPNTYGEGQSCTGSTEPDADVYAPEVTRFMGSFSAGFRFQFNNWLGLKAEVRDYIFTARVYEPDSAASSSDTIRNNLFVQLGVTFLLGGSDN